MVLHGGLTEGGPTGATTAFDPVGNRWYRLPDGPARSFHRAVEIAPGAVVLVGGASDSDPVLLDILGPANDPSSQHEINGALVDGRPFTLTHDPLLRLCLDIDDPDFAPECDDSGAFSGDQDQTQPRYLPDVHDPYELLVAYGYLPPGMTDVDIKLPDGGHLSGSAVAGGYPRLWAIPLPPGIDGMSTPTVRYRSGPTTTATQRGEIEVAGEVGPGGGVMWMDRELQSTPEELFVDQTDNKR